MNLTWEAITAIVAITVALGGLIGMFVSLKIENVVERTIRAELKGLDIVMARRFVEIRRCLNRHEDFEHRLATLEARLPEEA